MHIEGSLEDELFSVDNKTKVEFLAEAAVDPTMSYVATQPFEKFVRNITHSKNLMKRLTLPPLPQSHFPRARIPVTA
jgi:hypothetical protein